MHIELGAHVWTHEGQAAGKVTQLNVDSSQQTLDSFVVHTQWMGQDLIVLLRDVERVDADDTIHLTITGEQFRELRPYVVSDFVSRGSSYGTMYGYGGGVNSINMSSGGSRSQQFDYASGPLIGITDLSSSVVSTESSLSETEFGVTRGTRVMSADGHHIGSIHELSVADDGKLNGLVIASGHIRKHLQFVPTETVKDADSDAVYLRISAAEFKDLERAGQAENEQH